MEIPGPEIPSPPARPAGVPVPLERLLLLHYDRLLSYIDWHLPKDARSICGPEDILQDTYTAAVHHIADFEDRGDNAFYRWLATIARNKIRDFVNGQNRAKRGGGRIRVGEAESDAGSRVSSYDGLLEHLAVAPSTPSRTAARREAVASLQVAIAHLGDDMRRAVTLRYIEGQSVAEVAKAMDRTEGAIQQLCYRALRMMRVAMGRASAYLSSTA